MLRPVNASLDFINLSPDRKVPTGADIANGLKNHPDKFPNPPSSPEDLLKLNSELSNAAAKARTGDKVSIDAMHNVEKKWETAFRGAAKYVGSVANGDAEIIRMGGCTPTADENMPAQKPGASKNIVSAPGAGHGTAAIGCDADSHVKGYVYVAHSEGVEVLQDGDTLIFKTPGGDTIFVQGDTHRKIMFHNLASGKKLMLHVLPFNSAGSGPLSDGQSVIPQ